MRHFMSGKGHTTYLLPRLSRCAHINSRGGPTLGLALGGGYVQPAILSMGRLTGIGSSEPIRVETGETTAADA